MRIKICGITRIDDAVAAAGFGADAIGLVFAPRSPRRLGTAEAAAIAATVPDVVRVGLFVNPGATDVERVLASVSLDCLQFHGDEDAAFCRRFGMPYIKAIGLGDTSAMIERQLNEHANADALLFDSHRQGESGGSGRTANWTPLPAAAFRYLAGGLTAGNVASAIAVTMCNGVDVSSGVETSPGIKDHSKLQAFIEEVRRVARHAD